ncbi:MAG TPA: EAL domain-containing protein [Solirubrobacteraceae bacterium]|nr:EAL domain-containing protein [Solirubrobacteraceae bacterium]
MSLLTTAYLLAHFSGLHWLNSGPVYNVISGSTVVALIVGARKNSQERRLPWYLFALGQALFVTGDVLAYNYERFFGTALPFPSVADPFYLGFYPLLVAGLLLLIHERNETRDRASLIDALILTVSAAALSWVYLMAPYAHDRTLTLLTKLTSIAYPMMDILVLGVVLRLAVGSRRRGPAFGFLISGTAVLLITDAIYGWKLLHGGYTTGGVLDAGWAVFYMLLGAAALHPSMRGLSEPAPDPDGRLTRRRLALLTCASLTAPAVIVVREALGQTLDLYVLAGASTVLFALVIMRMTGIVHQHEEAIRREAALRVAGEELVTAITREEIYSAALRATRAVVDQDVTARLYLREGGQDGLIAVDSTDGDAASLPPLGLDELPARVRERLFGHGVVTLDGRPEGTACLSPLLSREELRGVLMVLPRLRLRRAVEESLATLAAEVALALESAALTEEALRQRSEARLSSLIKNASDVVCIVGQDAAVSYVSPSVERMFGYVLGALQDRSLLDIVHPGDAHKALAFIAAIAAQPADRPSTAEFRVRHVVHGWRDVEALGTNLLEDQAIQGLVLNIRDISERKAFEAELEHQAFHDTLTDLPNRGLFRNRVEHALASQRRDGLPVAVLFLDIDDFKNVNDSLGHVAGDRVLQEVGRRLEDCMRPVDTAARLGGDEFAVLIQGAASEMHSIEIAHRVIGTLAVPMSLDDRQISIRTSIGIAFSGEGAQAPRDADELLRDADAAMYMAKERGQGGYQIFEPEMHAQALARLELKTDLERAMVAGEFTLRYQPIMDLSKLVMAGMEALVRWEHPVRGTVAPAEFMSLVEDTGLIVPMGPHILREACEQAALMQRECPRTPPLSMSVNVSAFQLQRPEFIDEVRSALRDAEIPPSSLVLELTESVMMQDMELSIMRMKALRALGVRLAIDDFGTGYSSLNYIRQLPVDILKIDRSFLADSNPQVSELTAAIVQLARIFKLQAVAEGIENEEQLRRMREMRCDFGQGFHFAKPLSGEEIRAMAARQSRVSVVGASAAGAAFE